MVSKETATDFHQHFTKDDIEPGKFNVYRKALGETVKLSHHRRDFFKIALITEGEGFISFADQTIHVKGSALGFFNPVVPFSWEPVSSENAGYFCLFTEDFIDPHLKAESLSASPLFKINGNRILMPAEHTIAYLSGIFEQMIKEIQTNYINKYELLRSYVQIIIHEALKIEPVSDQFKTSTPYSRIASLFLDLLEKQFPAGSSIYIPEVKNANEFASRLGIHTNHLNKALKEITGKTTSEHITGRIIKEAKTRLLHSDLDIAEIGYCLGFGHASNFNVFFKKQTGQTPNSFRKQGASIS